MALLAAPAAFGQQTDVDFVKSKLDAMSWGQYMARACAPVEMANWAGFPTQACSYPSASYGTVSVVMLNADNDRMSKWLVTACGDATADDVRVCAERVALQIQCQSGNQFPVAGFVDEGGLYMFRDGVTVSLSEVNTAPAAGAAATIPLNRAPTPAETTAAMGGGTVTKVYKFGRVSSTTRAQFAAFTGQPVSTYAGLAWSATVRTEYQSAWTSNQNRLISAWAKANRTQLMTAVAFNDYKAAACPPNARWTRWL